MLSRRAHLDSSINLYRGLKLMVELFIGERRVVVGLHFARSCSQLARWSTQHTSLFNNFSAYVGLPSETGSNVGVVPCTRCMGMVNFVEWYLRLFCEDFTQKRYVQFNTTFANDLPWFATMLISSQKGVGRERAPASFKLRKNWKRSRQTLHPITLELNVTWTYDKNR